jgi:hypothetical protein
MEFEGEAASEEQFRKEGMSSNIRGLTDISREIITIAEERAWVGNGVYLLQRTFWLEKPEATGANGVKKHQAELPYESAGDPNCNMSAALPPCTCSVGFEGGGSRRWR